MAALTMIDTFHAKNIEDRETHCFLKDNTDDEKKSRKETKILTKADIRKY